jgi:hypothetical protein
MMIIIITTSIIIIIIVVTGRLVGGLAGGFTGRGPTSSSEVGPFTDHWLFVL